MLDQDDIKENLNDIKINPAIDASMLEQQRKKPAVHLPQILHHIEDKNMIAHVLKHADDRVLTGQEIKNGLFL